MSGIEANIVCGASRGKKDVFQTSEMLDCTEVFGSMVLHDLLNQAKDAKWIAGDKTKTRVLPKRKPKLNPDFKVSKHFAIY